ncbi:MAG: DUF4157 domain-containing protein [Pseudomonadota bacterium]
MTQARVHAPERAPARAMQPVRQRTDPAEHAADRAADEALGGRLRTPLAAASGVAEPIRPPGLGRALDRTTRADMEQRFGHSFASVRVHADGGAQRAAAALQARAFAHGPHIVFGAGRYAPHTSTGRQLLAHELAHVVQQSRPGAVARAMCAPVATAPAQTTARPPTPEEKQEFAREAVNFLKGQGDFFATLPEPRDPAKTLPHLRTSVNNGLKVLEGDASDQALKLAAELRTVYTDAVRAVLEAQTRIKPAAGSKPPTLLDLYETHRANIEPFAHPVDTGAQELSAELEAALPAQPSAAQRARHTALAGARQRMKVSTASVTMPIADLFGPAAGTPPALPAGMTVRFSSTVPAVLQPGFRGLVERMSHGILESNSTLMLALDLRAFGGGNDAYRFTCLDLGNARQPNNEVLVERQGAILTEGLNVAERKALQERFDRVGFKRASGFSDEEFDQVLIGLAEIPEAQLSSLGALNVVRASTDPASPTKAGEYSTDGHTLTMFDPAYAGSISRQGRAGRILKSAAFTVAHEIGHAQDMNVLRTTQDATKTAQDALIGQFGTGPNSWGIAGDAPAADRARYDTLNAARNTARTAQLAARGRSGARWPSSGNVTDTTARGDPTPAFRAAAQRDDGPGSPRMPTDYPNPSPIWREYYAECYALYQTNPDLLRRVRPHVFDHLKAEFPK